MNKRLFINAFFLIPLCLIIGQSYACPTVTAIIQEPIPKFFGKDMPAGFYGGSSIGYIGSCLWTIPSGAGPYDVAYHTNHYSNDIVNCKFETVGGPYLAALTVSHAVFPHITDNTTCTFYVVEADLDIDDVDDDDEENPGGFVSLNDDDDDGDGVVDYYDGYNRNGNSGDDDDTNPQENDLVEISLSVSPSLSTGTMTLAFYEGAYTGLRVWSSSTKGEGNMIIPNGDPLLYYKDWDLSQESMPPTLYVEGTSANGGPRFNELWLAYKRDAATKHTDTVNFTVVKVDLDISAVADEDEESVGGFIALNDDDDNDNDTYDKDESGPVTDELDLIQIILQEVLPTNLTGNVTLKKVPSDSTKIKIWESYTKGGSPITLPKTYATPADLPKSLYVEGYSPSASVRDVNLALEFTIGGKTFDDKVKITVIDVDYTEDASQTYGYDSYTDSPTIDYFPYKSVKVGDSDTVYADSSMTDEVYFTSSNTGTVTVSPSQPSSTHQQVTFTGVSEGFIQGRAELYDPVQYDIIAAATGVYAYEQDSYTLAVRVVHENDDVQVIQPGQSGTSSTDICVSPGANGKRDTDKGGDDVYSGENILVGANLKCDSTVFYYVSTDPYTAAALQNYLNNTIYNQSVVKWAHVAKESAMTVNFDLDSDGELDVSRSGWTSEQLVIINNCDPGDYDSVVFIVNNPSESWGGCAVKNQKYAFVFPDVSSPHEEKATGHELGHCEFGLSDLETPDSSDALNLMWYQLHAYMGRLRKGQWINIQAKK